MISAVTRPTRFDQLPTEQLRAMATKTDGGRCDWQKFDRAMLLAFFHNRHGKNLPGANYENHEPNAARDV